MEAYAVVETGGKQYLVQPGDVLKIEKLDVKQGDTVTFETLLTFEGENMDEPPEEEESEEGIKD